MTISAAPPLDALVSGLGQELKVGPLTIRNRVFLAPMSGVSDAPFRALAWRYGAGLVFSEMIASEALVEGEAEMTRKLDACGSDIHAVQLAGREAEWMARAARLAVERGADLIDINMGCPAKRVTTGYSGSALMRDLDHAQSLIDAVVGAVDVPVTVKMRLGWDHDSINAPELARRAEASGAAMITVHGRTRCQFYKGNADWSAVRAVRDAISLPLVINGDIGSAGEAATALRASGADAVMVGRSSYGAPWLPGLVAGSRHAPHEIDDRFVIALAMEHHRAMVDAHGSHAGLRQARKHLAWYFERLSGKIEPGLRRLILTADDAAQVQAALGMIASTSERQAA